MSDAEQKLDTQMVIMAYDTVIRDWMSDDTMPKHVRKFIKGYLKARRWELKNVWLTGAVESYTLEELESMEGDEKDE
jgi:hypothetical protein